MVSSSYCSFGFAAMHLYGDHVQYAAFGSLIGNLLIK